MNWIFDRLKEKTTWGGLVTLLTTIGVKMSPEMAEALITAGIALVSFIFIIMKEKK